MKTINIYPKYGINSILDIARGFKNLGTLNKKSILEFWRLLYSISRVHWASTYNLCAPWDIYRSLNPLFWWWNGAMIAYLLTLVLVFYFFIPRYIYFNVNICSMHICTRGPQISWIQKVQFHFSKSNFLVPKIFYFEIEISVIPHFSSILAQWQ